MPFRLNRWHLILNLIEELVLKDIGKEKSTMTYHHDISHHDISAWHIIYMSWRCHHDIYRVLICHGTYFEDISQYVVMTYHTTYMCHHDISNDVSHDVSPWQVPRMTYRMTPVTIRHWQDISQCISRHGSFICHAIRHGDICHAICHANRVICHVDTRYMSCWTV